ncbi:MAG: hypothetical protein JO305_05510 [Alphaproteobacteria bacterium]|nr:hypothetical protein [Alphaproteobacteria bacterium]
MAAACAGPLRGSAHFTPTWVKLRAPGQRDAKHMVWDWIEPKTLAVVRMITARIDRRWYDVVIRPDRVVVSERPTGRQRSFYLLRQLEDFCVGLGAAPKAQEVAPRRTTEPVAPPWRGRWQPRPAASPEELKNEVARLHETVTILRNKRRQAEAERDRWERLARNLEAELIEMRGLTGPAAGSFAAADRYRRAKKAVARLTHPDSAGATGLEAKIREKLFKEFWAEFERIEAEP